MFLFFVHNMWRYVFTFVTCDGVKRLRYSCSIFVMFLQAIQNFRRKVNAQQTRTLLVALSLACLEMSFVVKGPGAVILLFRLDYKTSVVCHNVNTQKVKIASRDRPHILASNRCETFENLLHIDIVPLRSTPSGILHSKNWTMIFIGIRGPWALSV